MAREKIKEMHVIFDKIQKYRYKADRVKCLKREETFALKTILQLAFNKNITLDLPEGCAGYTPKDNMDYDVNAVIRPIGECVKSNIQLPIVKERVFLQIVKGLIKEDAKIVIAAKDGKLTEMYDKLKYEIVKEAYPELV